MAQPWRTQFQPLITGRWYLPNLTCNYTINSAGGGPNCVVSPVLLDLIYTFDRAGLFVFANPNANFQARIGVYKMDPVTHLPSVFVEQLGVVSLGSVSPTLTLSPTRSYSGLIGLAVQFEGSGGTAPSVRCEFAADLPTIGYGYAAPYTGGTSGAAQYAFAINSSQGAVNGSFPATSAFSYARLQGNGSGVALRRA